MASYVHKNLRRDVTDVAVEGGLSPILEARFARKDLGCEATGFGYQRLQEGQRSPFGHSHDAAEEVYVVIGGGGRMKLDDDVIELAKLDAVRVDPTVKRAFEAGPDGLEVLVFGPHVEGDGAVHPDFWPSG